MYDQFMGVIKALGFNFVPNSWGWCAGTLLSIAQFQALFSLLGSEFGGDWRNVFQLPDLRSRSPMGYGTAPGFMPRSMGMLYGKEREELDTSYMPAHTHAHDYTGTSGNGMVMHAAKVPGKKELPSTGDYIAPPGSELGAITDEMFIAPADVTEADKRTIGGVKPGTGGFVSDFLSIDYTNTASSAFEIQQPSQSVNYCICMEGIYPARS